MTSAVAAMVPTDVKEAAKKKIEEEMGKNAPGTIKCFFPCCGGPVGTTEAFMFMVPADQQDKAKAAIAKYKEI